MVTIGRKYNGKGQQLEQQNGKFRINDDIEWRGNVMVIDENGERLGAMSVDDAQAIADERALDLVEIVPDGDPPVCRVMNYGKYLYDQEKRKKQARKNSKANALKEVKFRCRIADNDLKVKVRSIEKFLRQGSPVRITVMFRGREVTHVEIANNLVQRILDSIETECSVLSKPEMQGKNMSIVISPKPGKQ